MLAGINTEIAYGFFKHAKRAIETKAQEQMRSLLDRAGVEVKGAVKEIALSSAAISASEKVTVMIRVHAGQGRSIRNVTEVRAAF